MLRFILLSSLLITYSSGVGAQEASTLPADSTVVKNIDTTAKKESPQKSDQKVPISFRFNGISLSADIFGLAYSLMSDYTSSEIAVEFNIGNRIYPIIEVGYGWCDTTDDTNGIHYKTAAPYYKAGVNYNFSTTRANPNPRYSIYGLARCGWTRCKYNVKTPPITDPVWGGSTALDLKDVTGEAIWAEVGVGIKVKITDYFHMGWSVRYLMRIDQEKGKHSQMWYIPGYGINSSTTFGGTYSLIFDIPF